MSKEQKIEEMARTIMNTPPLPMQILGRAQGKRYMTAHHIAEHLYAQDYRKQSEWISVEERLPPVNSTVDLREIQYDPNLPVYEREVRRDEVFYLDGKTYTFSKYGFNYYSELECIIGGE